MLEACVVFVKTDTSGNCLPQLLIERGGAGERDSAAFIHYANLRQRMNRERERETGKGGGSKNAGVPKSIEAN